VSGELMAELVQRIECRLDCTVECRLGCTVERRLGCTGESLGVVADRDVIA
jgi:hypothetical protein